MAARIPYAILTKRVTFSGWKSFQMNETVEFHGVTEMTFPSIVRRPLSTSTVWGGLFAHSASRASSLGTHVHFLMQEDTKDFATSQPAGALFTIVLCDFSVATFRQKVERYAGMAVSPGRLCARLAASLRRTWPSTRTAPVTARGGEAVSWLPGDEEVLVPCHVSLVKHCLERGWDFCSEHHVSRLHQDVWPRVSARTAWGPRCN